MVITVTTVAGWELYLNVFSPDETEVWVTAAFDIATRFTVSAWRVAVTTTSPRRSSVARLVLAAVGGAVWASALPAATLTSALVIKRRYTRLL